MIETRLIKLGRGKVISKIDIASCPGSFPIYSSARLKDGKFGEYGQYEFDQELITWSVDGGGQFFYRPKHKFSVTNVAGTLEILDTKKVNYEFLYYALTEKHSRLVFDWIRKAHPSVIRRLYTEIPLPPLGDQKRIVHLLRTVEGLIAQRKQHLQHLDDLLKSVFLDMFGDPVRNEKGWEKNVLRDTTLKFSDGPFGSNLKTSHYQNEGIRVIRLNNIGVWNFNDSDKVYVSQQHYENVLKKHTCLPGDIIIGTMGDPNIRACLLPENISVAINKSDCVLCRTNPKIVSPYYILGLLNNPCALSLISNLLHGQTRTRVSMGQLAKLEIPIPPLERQNQFAVIVKKVEGLKSRYQESLADLQNVYDALSQKAFKGELDLSRVRLSEEK